ncbi:MAG: CHAT domain-containing protein [Rivularia sp. (in: cyanobacteria)]
MTKVILGFGNGNLRNGCDHISVEVRNSDDKLIARGNGSLPASPELWKLYKSWKSSFIRHFGGRIVIIEDSVSSSSEVEMELSKCINQFPKAFNQWLNCDGFRSIEKLLLHHLSFDAAVSFTVEANDNQLRRLPWYLWEFFDDYRYAEPSLAFSKYESGRIGKSSRDNVRVLVVIGDSQGINTEVDKKIFEESLGDTEVTIVSQPSRQDLDESLWDEQGWDILAFLGHSGSSEDGDTGSIKINSTENLSLVDLKNALSSSIKKGLKLAIFNSCDGLGLVSDLRDLYLPHTIVMREPVPDKIAQEFIKNFLPAFKNGKSLSMAVREAREKLQRWENFCACATWLPVLCQNPGVESLNWVNLGGKTACPYRGLFAFGEQDADIFFGREALSKELYQRVQRREPLIAVVGASGSGKSSVVFAGLIPQLRKNSNIQIVHFRPGKNPFESLAVALAPLWYEANGNLTSDVNSDRQQFDVENLIAKLQDKRGLCEVVETIITPSVANSSPHLVIIADQFEEIYTLSPQSKQDTCNSILDSLLNAVNDSPGFTLVLTLRADFFHHAIKNRKFADALRNTNYPLGPMNREELQRVIKLPAEKRGVKLERGLLEIILDDVGEKAENLPLLEFALTQLWAFQEYGLLKTAAYRKIGGLQQSLALHAENIYTQLNSEERQRMQRVFIQLVRPGEGAADTRNIVSKSDLQSSDWDLITLLNQEDARLLVINYDQNKRETVEIVHEALINGWGRLNNWMAYHRQFRTWQERLKISIKNWQEKNNDDGYLLSGGGLGEAEEWLNSQEHFCYLSDSQREFIQLSLDARDQKIKEEKSKQKRTNLGFAGLSIISLVFAGFAGVNWMQSDITSTREKLNNLILTSKEFFNAQKYDDALFEAIKAKQLLENTLWKNHLSDYTLKVNIATDRPMIFFTEPKQTIAAHKNRVWGVSFSPDGNTIASASADNTVKLWSIKERKLIHTFEGHTAGVASVSFSPDGNTIASGSLDNTVKLWSVKERKLIHTFEGHTKTVRNVDFSPDGNTIASSSYDNKVKLWSVKDGKLIHTLEGHTNLAMSVDFSPDGNTIASSSYDNTVKLWSVKDGKLIHSFKGHQSNVLSVDFSPDGNTITSGSDDNTVKLWSVKKRELIHIFEGHQSSVRNVSFSRDGNTIASGSDDNTVKLWSVKKRKLIDTLSAHKSSVWSVDFSPDDNTIVSGSSDNTVKLWSIKEDKFIDTLQGDRFDVNSVNFSPDGKTIASASLDNTVKLWSVKDSKLIDTLQGHKSSVFSVDFSPDGNTIASGSRDNTVKLWSVKNGEVIKSFQKHKDFVNSVNFSPDGNTIASGSDDNTVKLWSVKERKLIHTLHRHTNRIRSVDFSPDGNTIASGSDDNTVKLWSVKDGKLIHTFRGHISRVWSVDFSPDGNTIASGSSDNTVKLWSVKERKLIHSFKGHQQAVRSVDFSPDSKTIASGSEDNTVKLWWVKDGKLIDSFKGHTNTVRSVDFSPHGKTIASGSFDNTIKLWNLNFDKLLKRSCNKLKDYLENRPEKLEELKVCQNKEILTAAASTLVRLGEKLAEYGNFEEAVEKFQQAKKWNRQLKINPEAKAAIAFVYQGKELVRDGKVKEAVAAYNKALKINPELKISADDWGSLCWHGAINNQVKDVMFACEKAVALTSKDEVASRRIRGVARALTGDTSGAIKDFEAYVKSVNDNRWKSQVEGWIKDLRNDKNPFTEEKLEEWRRNPN